jgi:predicted nucleic acid-binding protein
LLRNAEVLLPEICDYELRRKLLHLIRKGQSKQRSIDRLDELGKLLDYLPLDTDTMLRAAQVWAEARLRGLPTAPDHSLDGDVILAAQALEVNGTVVTHNPKHLSRFVPAQKWEDITL